MYGCEAFGNKIPDGLEEVYHKLIKTALGVRPSTPNHLAIIEAGMLPIKSIILARNSIILEDLKSLYN